MTDSPPPHLRALTAELPTRDYLAAMWSRREFAVALPLEEVRSAHQNTLLGNVWHLGNPLLSVAVYYIVFGLMLEANRGVDNFILWLSLGVFAYRLTTGCVLGGATSIRRNRGLMRSIRFPRALLPISVVLSELLTFGFQLVVLGLIAVATGAPPSSRWLVLPAVVALHSALNLGGAFVAARLNDSFRDIEQIIPFVFRLLMYISGVMFPLEPLLARDAIPTFVRHVVEWNPLVYVLELYRWVFLGSAVEPAGVVRLLVISVVLLAFGFRFFRAGEYRYGLQG